MVQHSSHIWRITQWLLLFAISGTVSASFLPRYPRAISPSPSPTPVKAYYLNIEIINRVFNDTLLDSSSKDYIQMRSEVTAVLNNVYNCSQCSTSTFYGGVQQMTFSKGSVIAKCTVVFYTTYINQYVVKFLFLKSLLDSPPADLQINSTYTQDVVTPFPVPTAKSTTPLTRTTTPATTSTTPPTTTTTPATTSTTHFTATTTSTTNVPNTAPTTTINITPNISTPNMTSTQTTKHFSTTALNTVDPSLGNTTQGANTTTMSTLPFVTSKPSGKNNNTKPSAKPTSGTSSSSQASPAAGGGGGDGGGNWVPGWGIALLVLAAIILLLLIIIFIMMVVRWCCKKEPIYSDEKVVPMDSPPLPYAPNAPVQPTAIEDPHHPKKNRTGMYVVNP